MSEYLRAVKTPRPDTLLRLLQHLDLTYADVEELETRDLPDPSEIIMIPHDGLAEAGGGYVNDGEELSPYAFSRDMLQRIAPGTNPSRFRMHIIVGDSLIDEIPPGWLVLYQPTEVLNADGLYVLDLDEGRIVKYLQRSGGGVITLLSANKRYLPESYLPLEDQPGWFRSERFGSVASIRIVGKVASYLKPA